MTDREIKNAKGQGTEYKLFDGGGLLLAVTPNGAKHWRMKYRFEGKEKLLSFGAYPEISLADARTRREEARKLLANGIDPGALKKSLQQAQTEEKECF